MTHIRLLVVQTSRGLSAEVKVVASLIRGVIRHTSHDTDSVHVLLIGGTDDRYDPSQWSDSMKAFQGLEHVEVVPLQMGYLDRKGGSKVKSLAQLLFQLPALLGVIRRWRPTIVYSSQQKWDIYLASLIALFIRVPRVTHVHYVIGNWLGKGIVALLRRSTAVICVSEFIRSTAIRQGIPRRKAYTIYNSLVVDPSLPEDAQAAARRRIRHELGLAEKDKVIGMVGQLCEQKGQHLLIQALVTVSRACPYAHLLLIGEGERGATDYKDRLAQLVEKNHLQGRVHFLGFRRDIPQLLAACDIYAHPSHYDSFSLAVLEASAAGLPVVAWNDGGPAEIVESGQTGLLAAPGAVDELAGYLIDVLLDASCARTMGQLGQERARTVFNADRTSRSFLDVLLRVAGAHPQEQDVDLFHAVEKKSGAVR